MGTRARLHSGRKTLKTGRVTKFEGAFMTICRVRSTYGGPRRRKYVTVLGLNPLVDLLPVHGHTFGHSRRVGPDCPLRQAP